MKSQKFLFSALALSCTILLTSCYEHKHSQLRIKSFLWENVFYQAKYNHNGLLKMLDASEKDIIFYYNEENKLYKADILIAGKTTPESIFKFDQSPDGITKITWYKNGAIQHVIDFTYGTDGQLVHLLNSQEGTTDPYGQHNLEIDFVGNNVPYLLSTINGIPFTQFEAESFDDNKNPFKMLAESVGNPAFFPIGSFVFFQLPVIENNIPYISWLSANNPSNLRYSNVDSPGSFAVEQPLNYTFYAHGMVKKIIWKNTLNGVSYNTPYVFQFDYESYSPQHMH